jgi:GH35 family endo-1,4-beta-xylanase
LKTTTKLKERFPKDINNNYLIIRKLKVFLVALSKLIQIGILYFIVHPFCVNANDGLEFSGMKLPQVNKKDIVYQRPEGTTLKELAIKRNIEFGANFASLLFGPNDNNWASSTSIKAQKAISKDHFTILSAGWEMFPGNLWTGPKQYNFKGTDVFLNWAEENNFKVHAHGLGYVRYGKMADPKWLVSQEVNADNKN